MTEFYKDIILQDGNQILNFRIKLANDKKHKYTSYLIDGKELKRPVHFGAYGMQHYYDKIGYFKNLNHNDKKRLENFRNRFKSTYMKYVQNKTTLIERSKSPLFWSWLYLW